MYDLSHKIVGYMSCMSIKSKFYPTKSWYIPQKTMAIFATMVSLRNWVGGEIVQARGKPRGTKTLRWVFLKERTMKPHHKLFFSFCFCPSWFLSTRFLPCQLNVLSFFLWGLQMREFTTENKKGNQQIEIVFGEWFQGWKHAFPDFSSKFLGWNCVE